MGLFRSGVKWRCTQCGTVHRSNPEKCRDCEHTVFIQHNSKTKRSRSSSSGHRSEGGSRYRCNKCGCIHDRKPFVCDKCGSSAVRKVASSTASGKSRNGSPLRLHPVLKLFFWTMLFASGWWVYTRYLGHATILEWIAIPIAFGAVWIVAWIFILGLFGRRPKNNSC